MMLKVLRVLHTGVWLIAGAVEVVLTLRIVLTLTDLSLFQYTSILYHYSSPLLQPFNPLFTPGNSSGAYLDVVSLFALAVYALITWALQNILDICIQKLVEKNKSLS